MLSHLMLDVLTESECVDERALCIAPFRLAWALYIDLICLNHDGNVQDACVLAMISALKTLKLPEVNWIVDESAGELNDDSGQVRLKRLTNKEAIVTNVGLSRSRLHSHSR